MPSHKSTAQGRAAAATLADPESLVRFVELLKLRSLAPSTQAEYVRYLRKLAAHVGHDPAQLDEAQVRAYVLHLKTAHKYSPSSMRTACAALQNFYVKLYNRDWKLFDLVRSPDDKKLPAVLTRAEIARLFTTVREPRFQMVLRLIYACGLRISEAIKLEVTDIKKDGPRLYIRRAKGRKDRCVPLPMWAYRELRAWWKTHRHPKWVFPGVGRGWRDGASSPAALAGAVEPMGDGSIQHCMRLVVAAARLPKGTCTHTLRHSYATHLLEEGINIRLISAYLGHVTLETTMIYLHLTALNEAGTHAALARLRPPASPTSG
jgi:site-specific recombinase XerD